MQNAEMHSRKQTNRVLFLKVPCTGNPPSEGAKDDREDLDTILLYIIHVSPNLVIVNSMYFPCHSFRFHVTMCAHISQAILSKDNVFYCIS